jgi:uncharacterized protein (TIGR03437 family)
MVGRKCIVIAAAAICALAASENLTATCTGTVIAYEASGWFGSNVVSGADKLRLAGEPFTIDLYVCETKAPSQIGLDYAAYANIELTGTVKSSLITTVYTIKPTPVTLILAQPVAGTDSIELEGPIVVFGATINIHGDISLPAGTLTSTSIAPFTSVPIVTSNSGFIYAQTGEATELSLIGTAAGVIYTGGTPSASPFLHGGAVQVITAHADGTHSARPMQTGPVELGTTADTVMLRFYASGVRDASEVHLFIAGQDVPVRYSGAAAYFPGLDEVTVELPRSLAGVGEADVVLTADGQTASPVRIHIN